MSTEYERLVSLFHSLVQAGDERMRSSLMEELDSALNPLGVRGIRFDMEHPEVRKFFADPVLALGGGGTITSKGQTIDLGGSTIGRVINVQVGGNSGACTVSVQAWMPMATAPIGCWDIGGPGGQQIQLGGTCGGTPPVAGQPCTIKAVGKDGLFPTAVVWN
jgi:hypothetical protein